jgi:hypothetical protein
MMLPQSEGYVPKSGVWRWAAYAIWRGSANSLTVIRLLHLVDEQQFARASGAVSHEDRIRHICDMGRGSILDLVPAPTALVEDGRVLTVNRPLVEDRLLHSAIAR